MGDEPMKRNIKLRKIRGAICQVYVITLVQSLILSPTNVKTWLVFATGLRRYRYPYEIPFPMIALERKNRAGTGGALKHSNILLKLSYDCSS